ncbi:Trypanosomal VSG domain containing protein, putative [Trypanosoma equiperdum]|uniref:Trypanosomal VSG domain containing protein, putative n=1 Tax=Trypanosoma equiperdum TaxID=5694 RepID=A0A1G4I6W4_TRYEQ|nr:Trypanosomal VSG domain containing protein, putative [Trypanosoma equiperdum]
MTLADETWIAIFTKNRGGNDYLDFFPQEVRYPPEWASKWQAWVTALKQLKQGKGSGDKTIEAFTKLDSSLKQLAREKLANAMRTITELEQKKELLDKDLAEPARTQLRTTIKTALFGNPTKTRANVQKADAFKTITCNSASTCCEDDVPTTKATTVTATITCLCAKEASDGVDGACGFTALPSNTWTKGSNPADAVLTELLTFCPKAPASQLLGTRLRHVLDQLKSSVRIKSGSGYIGEFKSTNCDTTNAQGLCVKYIGYTGEAGKGFNDITWASSLLELADKLISRDEAAAAAAAIDRQIAAEYSKAMGIVTEVEATARALKHNANAIPEAKQTTKVPETDQTCEKKGTGTACKEGCKVEGEGDNKKCIKDPDYKPKQAEETKEDDKPTNTTTSNSFVINRAPLLLAFFLIG